MQVMTLSVHYCGWTNQNAIKSLFMYVNEIRNELACIKILPGGFYIIINKYMCVYVCVFVVSVTNCS
jgi:hypothetical protein